MMKITALFLAMFVSFLTLKPSLDVIVSHFTSTEQSCKNTECLPFANADSPDQEGQDNGCSGKTCNPFHLCTSGIVLVGDVFTFEDVNHYFLTKKERFNYLHSISASYTSDFWNPPKMS